MSSNGTGQHRHSEAFCLMWYACKCGHRERAWNSRDGVTPYMLECPSCGELPLRRLAWKSGVRCPNHTPNPGQLVFRDGTADEAEQIMRDRLDALHLGDSFTDERKAKLIEGARKTAMGELNHEDKNFNHEFQPGWPMVTRSRLASEVEKA